MNRLAYLLAGIAVGSVWSGGAAAVSRGTLTVQDAAMQSPKYYKVLLETDQVRVLEIIGVTEVHSLAVEIKRR
jgi:hypothetical protein